ncbi:MAG: sugar ABC transporter ATP-binding protein [Geminicoccaceae bacterium]|nr:sugar ABC transporter ATP-binding protein [Geminicoccaceae bacterium]
MSALLELTNVQKRFGSIQALSGISFSVARGEVLALVGDNGAGKSTLMKTISGIYSADEGTIRFDGQDITRTLPGEIRERGIEMIYQDLALARQQNVAANIFLGREPVRKWLGFLPMIDRRRIDEEARRMVERLGARIPSIHVDVGYLSGGQQQSVAIARALTFDPKLVIMDEPTAALAVREVEHVLDLIRGLREQGISVILISHRLTDVFAVSDRIVALRQGQVIAEEETARTNMQEVVAHIVGAH